MTLTPGDLHKLDSSGVELLCPAGCHLQILLWSISGTRLLCPTGAAKAGSTKGGSITVPLTSCLIGLESAV
jgi:hypothetical protein